MPRRLPNPHAIPDGAAVCLVPQLAVRLGIDRSVVHGWLSSPGFRACVAHWSGAKRPRAWLSVQRLRDAGYLPAPQRVERPALSFSATLNPLVIPCA